MNKLVPPCSYQGGKQKIAAQIVDYITTNFHIDSKTKFFDLCCGSGAVSLEMISRGFEPSNIYMLDASLWGWFYKAISSGLFDMSEFTKRIKSIPTDISKIKSHMESLVHNAPNPYDFLILQAASYGSKAIWVKDGKWRTHGFRDYWLPTATSNRRSPVNPMMPMPDTLLDRTEQMYDACKGIHGCQADIFASLTGIPKDDAIIYIDPPYDDTCQYGYNFDVIDFVGKLKTKTNCPVIVSEARVLSDRYIELDVNTKKGMRSKNSKHEYLNIFCKEGR